MKKVILLVAILIVTASCSPKNPGFITLVNSGVENAKMYIDGRSFSIKPSHHITKEASSGVHELKLNNEPPIKANVEFEKTTVFDSSGLSCFVVADFTKRYSGERPTIREKFKYQMVFTTKDKMTSSLGGFLPKTLKDGGVAMRLHQVDCEYMDNDEELINSIMNLL